MVVPGSLGVLGGAGAGAGSDTELTLLFSVSFPPRLAGFRKQKQRLKPKQQREQQESSWQGEGPQVGGQRQRV